MSNIQFTYVTCKTDSLKGHKSKTFRKIKIVNKITQRHSKGCLALSFSYQPSNVPFEDAAEN